ncbi:TonB-dependent receptor [Oceanicoccus sp. KOV_DT_Chl]|uniref:TonB-dependent receptor n=1 Tax=Oceanicoccus sp. KOV_DT_Chl TaxID=1904639 RepID=UPI001356C981|nr:TonB-dependent receptor [Oceanicoccus sp. KOV_DT_Chl]
MTTFTKMAVRSITLLLSCAALSVSADTQLEEITVTAQKREQGLQDVPIALSAFQSEFIEGVGAELIDDLARFTPALTTQASTQGEPNIYIRGIGSNDFGVGGDISVGVFIDDIYVGRISGAISDLADAERVEILKGPQGTLFGRNTIGGAISITTKKPGQETAGKVKVETGSYNKKRVDASIEGAVTDSVTMRLSGLYNRRDGWKHNDFDNTDVEDENNRGLRWTTVFNNDAGFDAMFKLNYDKIDVISRGPQSTNPLYANGDFYDDINSDLGDNGLEKRSLYDASVHLGWDWGDYEFQSITGVRDTDYKSRKDTTGSGSRDARLRTNIFVDARQYSQEFRLNFDDGGDLFWFLGTSIFYEDVEQDSLLESTNETVKYVIQDRQPAIFPFIAVDFPDGVDYYEYLENAGEYYSYAVYGDATWKFTEDWELTFGLRYTLDEKEHMVDSRGPEPDKLVFFGTENFPGVVYQDLPVDENDESWDAWTPRLVLRWNQSDSNMFYGSIAKGFKSGGFNSFAPGNPFDPEFVWSYELGNKSSWLDNRLQLNAALFYYDYEDLQVNNIEGAVVVLRNAGEAQGQGFEFDANWLISENWQLMLSGNYLDTEFKEFVAAIDNVATDLAGDQMPLAPELQFSATLMYDTMLNSGASVDARLSYSWSDDYYFSVSNTPDEYQDAFGTVDARIAWTDASSHWTVAVFGQNLTDEEYLVDAGGLAKYDLNAAIAVAAIGRTVGVSAAYQF